MTSPGPDLTGECKVSPLIGVRSVPAVVRILSYAPSPGAWRLQLASTMYHHHHHHHHQHYHPSSPALSSSQHRLSMPGLETEDWTKTADNKTRNISYCNYNCNYTAFLSQLEKPWFQTQQVTISAV